MRAQKVARDVIGDERTGQLIVGVRKSARVDSCSRLIVGVLVGVVVECAQ